MATTPKLQNRKLATYHGSNVTPALRAIVWEYPKSNQLRHAPPYLVQVYGNGDVYLGDLRPASLVVAHALARSMTGSDEPEIHAPSENEPPTPGSKKPCGCP
jgi:hypothetical protein